MPDTDHVPSFLSDLGQHPTLPYDPPYADPFSHLPLASLSQREIQYQFIPDLSHGVDQGPHIVLYELDEIVTGQEVEDDVQGQEVSTTGEVVQVCRRRVGDEGLGGKGGHGSELRGETGVECGPPVRSVRAGRSGGYEGRGGEG